MKKLFFGLIGLALSQVAYAAPIISGAIDVASNDGETYYGLIINDGAYYVEGYTAAGVATGFSVELTPGNVNPDNQTLVGLGYDGSSFFVLRNDLASGNIGRDTWTVAGFAVDGTYNGFEVQLGPENVVPSRQTYVGLDATPDGFYALRDDSAWADSWTYIGFDLDGAYNGFEQMLEDKPSTVAYIGMAGYENSPLVLEATTNTRTASVPEPGTGLLLSALLLGVFGRKFKKA